MVGKTEMGGRARATPAEGERKLVTVLFTDIVGSTSLAGQPSWKGACTATLGKESLYSGSFAFRM